MTQETQGAIREEKDRTAAQNPAQAEGGAEESTEDTFENMLEDYMFIPRKGQTLDCMVTDVTNDGVYLNLSSKQTGYIPANRLSRSDRIVRGDTVPIIITNADSEEAYIYCDLVRDKAWAALEKARLEHQVLDCMVTQVNRGGVDAEYQGVHVFIPGSKSGIPRDGDKTVLLGKTVKVRILETDRKARRIIGAIRSERAERLQEQARRLWETLEAGQKYEGTVRNLTDYAAFVDIGGIDGLVHVSQISYDRIGLPSDVLSPGDKVQVWVVKADKERKKLNLTMKDPDRDCWAEFAAAHRPDDILSGKVRNLTDFGAFIAVAPGIEGLLRVSQISHQHVDVPSDVLTEGDQVNVRILEIHPDTHRLALSMKDVSQP